MTTNLESIANKIDSVIECIIKDRQVIEVAALEQGNALMSARIFGSEGGFSLDGSELGEYSDAYLRKRLRNNKGSNLNKNLIYDGNLFRSIQIGRSNNKKTALGFTDQDLADIARFQEESDVQVNEPIFGFNSEEMEICLEVIKNGVQQSLKRCFKTA